VSLLFFLLAGCGSHVSFDKVDLKGHVRVEQDGIGYCFHVPKEWEIREKLEGSDVVCLGPLEDGFRDSVVAKSLTASELSDPQAMFDEQLKTLADVATIVEPWSASDLPVVVTLRENRFSKDVLGQMLFLHIRPDGSGVLLTCTTTEARLSEKRESFEKIFAGVKYDLADCTGPGGLPKVFPTPEVTLSPSP